MSRGLYELAKLFASAKHEDACCVATFVAYDASVLTPQERAARAPYANWLTETRMTRDRYQRFVLRP